MADRPQEFMEVQCDGGEAVVKMHGRIGAAEASRLSRDLVALCEAGAVRLVVDISDVPLMGSAALGSFMVALRETRKKGGYVRLAGAQPLVRQVLETTKLTKLFDLYDSVEQARGGQ